MKRIYIIGPDHSAKAMAHKMGLQDGDWRHVGKASRLPRCRFNEHNQLFVTDDWHKLPDKDDIYSCVVNMATEDVMKQAGMTRE